MLVDRSCGSGIKESAGVDEDNKGWKSLVDRSKKKGKIGARGGKMVDGGGQFSGSKLGREMKGVREERR